MTWGDGPGLAPTACGIHNGGARTTDRHLVTCPDCCSASIVKTRPGPEVGARFDAQLGAWVALLVFAGDDEPVEYGTPFGRGDQASAVLAWARSEFAGASCG